MTEDRINTVARLIENCGYRRYLEIGCQGDACFSQVPIDKIGVDPNTGGTHRMTSDDFFARHDGSRFDIIFIDGDHRHPQVARDVDNALGVLAPGGVIVMHDCLPKDAEHENPWLCGTAWRAFAKLRTRPDLDCAVGDYDHGVGVVCVRPNTAPVSIPQSMDALTYGDLAANRGAWMRPIDFATATMWPRR